jgi:hypothetical protein
VAQREVLERVRSDSLVVFVVWEPILGGDRETAARRAVAFIPDPRARHYWTGELQLGEAFQAAVPLVNEPAWDVYLLYAAGVEWEGISPPTPSYYMHQLSGRLPVGRLLNGRTLAERTEAELRASPEQVDQ